jgi:hypothetical protein
MFVHGEHFLRIQMGVAPAQPALLKHSWQVLVAVSHTGDVPSQSVFAMHWTHVPLPAQAARNGSARAAHCGEVVQAVHFLLVQMGIAPPQVVLVRHSTQRLVDGSQTAAVPLQSALLAHWAHAPVLVHAPRMGSARSEHCSEEEHDTH